MLPATACYCQAQLVVEGPVHDCLGSSALARLAALAVAFPARVAAPRYSHYLDGEERKLLMRAADWCLLPSRWGRVCGGDADEGG